MRVRLLLWLVSSWPVSSTSSGCACFSWCHPEELQHFWAQLPVVRTTASPWYPYLRAVYGGDVPLPVDLREFGTFRIPSNESVALAPELNMPLSRSCDPRTSRSDARACEPAECRRWLDVSPARRAPLARVVSEERVGQVHKMLWAPLYDDRPEPALPWPGLRTKAVKYKYHSAPGLASLASGLIPDLTNQRWFNAERLPDLCRPATLALSPRQPRAVPLRNYSWVEVTRFATRLPEGLVYGCWATLLVPPHHRGGGVYVNTGRLLTAHSKRVLQASCEAEGWVRYRGLPPELGPSPRWLRLMLPRPGFTDLLGAQSDNFLAACVQRRGYDSAWLSREHILILTSPQCALPGTIEPIGACLPAPMRTRTGWHAERECACADRYPPNSTHPSARAAWILALGSNAGEFRRYGAFGETALWMNCVAGVGPPL
jgi:hypothetical protein